MDFNGDGLFDILSGSFPGELYVFAQSQDGTFQRGQPIQDKEGQPLKPGSASTAFAVDWDGDGDLDLLSGTIDGQVLLARNQKQRDQSAYEKCVSVEANGQAIRLANRGGDTHPIAVDWTGDGKLDLLVGTGNGDVLLYTNGIESSHGDPQFGEPIELVKGNSENVWGAAAQKADASPREPSCGVRTKLCVTDYNADGRLDLLVGDFNMAQREVRGPLTADEQKTKRQLMEKRAGLYREIQGSIDFNPFQAGKQPSQEELQRYQDEYNKAFQARADDLRQLEEQLSQYETQRTDYHGWVWVMLQKVK